MNKQDLRIGSLCTGYGGLDMAVTAVFGGKVVWTADNDRHVTAFLGARYPDIPNHGDLTQLDWQTVERADIIAAGFPCQDISYNGRGAGIEKGGRSGIWKNIMEGIRVLRPKFIVVENVAAIRRRGLDRVLGDLAEAGYYSVWTSIRASDIGAPHRRERVFILGYRPDEWLRLAVAYARRQRWPRRSVTGATAGRRPSGGSERPGARAVSTDAGHRATSVGDIAWGRYAEAIGRWAAVVGWPAPPPTERGKVGQTRLSPRFSEWLMGLPDGWVTGVSLPYSVQHRMLGNGVVPQQARAALRQLLALAVEDDPSH
jgi:DNA (cytosine-5)-methyltransferase 1